MAVYLIAGPPCSGKTTLAQRMAGPGDQVLDFDTYCQRLDGRPGWDHPLRVRQRAEQLLRRDIDSLIRARRRAGQHYVIRSCPTRQSRENLATALRATVWLLNPGQAECERRATVDRRPTHTHAGIRQWYRDYQPSPLDRRPNTDRSCPAP